MSVHVKSCGNVENTTVHTQHILCVWVCVCVSVNRWHVLAFKDSPVTADEFFITE